MKSHLEKSFKFFLKNVRMSCGSISVLFASLNSSLCYASSPQAERPSLVASTLEAKPNSVSCVLMLQEELLLPLENILLSCHLNDACQNPSEASSLNREEIGAAKNQLIGQLKTAPCKLVWDYNTLHPSICISSKEVAAQDSSHAKPMKNLCCLDPAPILKFWLEVKDLESFYQWLELSSVKDQNGHDLFSWKLEACEPLNVEDAKKRLKENLFKKASDEAHEIAQLLDAEFLGFKNLVFYPSESAGTRIQGAEFEAKSAILEDKNLPTKLCSIHASRLTQKLECVLELRPKS